MNNGDDEDDNNGIYEDDHNIRDVFVNGWQRLKKFFVHCDDNDDQHGREVLVNVLENKDNNDVGEVLFHGNYDEDGNVRASKLRANFLESGTCALCAPFLEGRSVRTDRPTDRPTD